MGRALAARLGVSFEAVEYATDPQRVEGLRGGAWDVTGVVLASQLAPLVDFSAPYLEVDGPYLVPAGSPIRQVADADRPGVRIAVGRGVSADVFLSREVKQATLVRAEQGEVTFEPLRTGQADALAGLRPNTLALPPLLPGSRVLEDRFTVQRQALAVPKGRPALHATVSAFVDEALALGLVRQIIARSGVPGIQAADSRAARTQLPRTGNAPMLHAVLVVGAGLLGLALALRRRSVPPAANC